MVGATGFEPVTTRTPSVCATRLRYAPTAVLN
jgi:integrase